ncbi:heme-binding protein [Chloroflexota bacterium]
MAIESPKYEVVLKENKFEIREYQGYLVAEVEIKGDYDRALSSGFRILADYIFGNNKKSTHIAMTAPVTEINAGQSEKVEMTAPVSAFSTEEGKYKISFMMPSKYTIDSLPQPNSEEIVFSKVEGYKAAVIRFSGFLNKKLVIKKQDELNDWLNSYNLTPKSAFISAQYNPPWIPGLFRRNEIIVKV